MGKIYKNNNQLLVEEMIKIYQPSDYDWMSYQITVKNILTFHHILEQKNGGLITIDNGALVTKKGHRALNIIENKSWLLYKAWNELFQEINKSKQPLDDYYITQSKILKKYTQKILYK